MGTNTQQQEPQHQNQQQVQSQSQQQSQIALQILISTQEDFINTLDAVSKHDDPQALQSNLYIGLMSLRANFQEAGQSLPAKQKSEFQKALTDKQNLPGCQQAVSDALQIYGSRSGAAALMDSNKYIDPNHVVDGTKLMAQFSQVQHHSNLIAKEVNDVRSGAKSAVNMNLRGDQYSGGGYYTGTEVDQADLQNASANFSTYEFPFNQDWVPLRLPIANQKTLGFKYSKTNKTVTFTDGLGGRQEYPIDELAQDQTEQMKILMQVNQGQLQLQQQRPAQEFNKPSHQNKKKTNHGKRGW